MAQAGQEAGKLDRPAVLLRARVDERRLPDLGRTDGGPTAKDEGTIEVQQPRGSLGPPNGA